MLPVKNGHKKARTGAFPVRVDPSDNLARADKWFWLRPGGPEELAAVRIEDVLTGELANPNDV